MARQLPLIIRHCATPPPNTGCPPCAKRRLEPAGGFSAVVGGVRAERAGDLLVRTAHPLSLVGFACGYADQSHFTREFMRRAAMTPAAYRDAFARAA